MKELATIYIYSSCSNILLWLKKQLEKHSNIQIVMETILQFILYYPKLTFTRWVALMIQLEQQQHGEFVGGVVVVGWLTPTTYIQLAGAGSISLFNIKVILFMFFLLLHNNNTLWTAIHNSICNFKSLKNSLLHIKETIDTELYFPRRRVISNQIQTLQLQYLQDVQKF